MNTYINFVRNHAVFVRPVEGLLRTVTFFLPSRFHENGNGEITTEAALAASNIMTLINDLILLKPGIPTTAALLPRPQDRIGLLLTLIAHTEVLMEKISLRVGAGSDHVVILALETLKAMLRFMLLNLQTGAPGATEGTILLDGGRFFPALEAGGASAGAGGWNGNSAQMTETEEAAALLLIKGGGGVGDLSGNGEEGEALLAPRQEWRRGKRTGRKFLYYTAEGEEGVKGREGEQKGEQEEEEEEGKEDDQDKTSTEGSTSPSSSSSSSSSSSASRFLTTSSSALPQTTMATQTLFSRSREEEDATVAKARARLLFVGEILHILRPLVYAYLRWMVARRRRQQQQQPPPQPYRKIGTQQQSTGTGGGPRPEDWLPFLLSGLMDAVSHQCTTNAINRQAPLKRSYQEELQRRRSLWMLYLLRTPVFEGITLPVANAVDQSVGRIPIVGGFVNYAFGAMVYVQKHFFYISGS